MEYTMEYARLDSSQSQLLQTQPRHTTTTVDFTDGTGNGWILTTFLILAGTVSLGILSLPHAYMTLGYIPATLCIITLGAIATHTGLLLLHLSVEHPDITSYGDAALIVWGYWGRAFIHNSQIVLLIMYIASSLLVAGAAIHSVFSHSCLTLLNLAVAIVGMISSSPRTMHSVGLLSTVSIFSISVALTCAITSIVPHEPFLQGQDGGNLYQDGLQVLTYYIASPSFTEAILAVTNILFAFAGHLVFFEFICEMKNRLEFRKSLFVAQIATIITYVGFGSLIYSKTGNFTAQIVLENISVSTMRKLAWILLLPNLVIGGVVDAHVVCHHLIRCITNGVCSLSLQKTDFESGIEAQTNTETNTETQTITAMDHTLNHHSHGKHESDHHQHHHLPSQKVQKLSVPDRYLWILGQIFLWICSWVITEVIPVFIDLLGVISSIFATAFTYALPCLFWMVECSRHPTVVANRVGNLYFFYLVAVIALACIMLVLGLVSSIRDLIQNFRASEALSPFRCGK